VFSGYYGVPTVYRGIRGEWGLGLTDFVHRGQPGVSIDTATPYKKV
jgi:hypothetical protein